MPLFDPLMLQGLASQFAGAMPQQQGGAGGPGGFNPLAAFGGGGLPPWLAAMRGGNPLGALMQRFQGGQGGTPIIPQGGQGAGVGGGSPQAFWNPAAWGAGNPNAQAIAQRTMPVAGAQPGAAPQPGGGGGDPYGAWSAASRQNFNQARPWDPSAWGGANAAAGGLQNARDLMHQNTQVPGAQGASMPAPTPAPQATQAWNPAGWGAGNPQAQSTMHQNMAAGGGGQPGVTQGTKQASPAVAGALGGQQTRVRSKTGGG